MKLTNRILFAFALLISSAISLEAQAVGAPTAPTSTTTTTVGAKSITVTCTAASGDLPMSFQFRKNGAAIVTGLVTPSPAARTASFVILNPAITDSGTYDCVVHNAAGDTQSDAGAVTVNPAPVLAGGVKVSVTVQLSTGG